jgi:hypothetical protein
MSCDSGAWVVSPDAVPDAGKDVATDAGYDAENDDAHPGCSFYYPSLAGWGLCMKCPDGTVPYRSRLFSLAVSRELGHLRAAVTTDENHGRDDREL